MFTIIDYSQDRHFIRGVQAIAACVKASSRECCIIIPDREQPLTSLLAFCKEYAGRWQNVIVFLDILSASVVSSVIGNEHQVMLVSRKARPSTLMRKMNRAIRQKEAQPATKKVTLTTCESRLALSLQRGNSPEDIAYVLQRSVKTLSAQKRRIMEKLGTPGNVMFMRLIADPAFCQVVALLSAPMG